MHIKQGALTPVSFSDMEPQIVPTLMICSAVRLVWRQGVAMVVALRSGSTTRFELGDGDAFTANMSLPTTEDPEEITWPIYDLQAHIRATNSFRPTPLAFLCVSILRFPGVDSVRWTRSR